MSTISTVRSSQHAGRNSQRQATAAADSSTSGPANRRKGVVQKATLEFEKLEGKRVEAEARDAAAQAGEWLNEAATKVTDGLAPLKLKIVETFQTLDHMDAETIYVGCVGALVGAIPVVGAGINVLALASPVSNRPPERTGLLATLGLLANMGSLFALSLCSTHPVLGGVLGGLGLATSATTASILLTDSFTYANFGTHVAPGLERPQLRGSERSGDHRNAEPARSRGSDRAGAPQGGQRGAPMKVNRSMVPKEFFGDGNPTVPRKYFGEVANREAIDYETVSAQLTSPDRYRQIDDELAAGRFPQGLDTLSNADMVREMEREVNLIPGAISSAFIGGALGLLCLGPVGIGAAVLAGVVHTRSKYRAYTGSVTVERDGQSSERQFWLYPHLYQRTPEEARHLLLQKGVLGDRLAPVAFPALPPPDPQLLERLKPFSGKLIELSKDRRLVADLGARSRYGEPALSLVDGAVARRLLAADRKLYVIDGGSPESVYHTYHAAGASSSGSSTLDDHYDYNELRFGYSLHPLGCPEDLGNVPAGQGLPAPLLGVYRDGHPVSQVVCTSESERAANVEHWGFFDGELDSITRETNQLHDCQTATR
ncbi:MAG: hypothetical protein HY319_28575 [Armatimonadetes bacterium]|nr:hypothetical protein [Armatimonadota bacterium]